MSTKEQAIYYLNILEPDKLKSALDYIQYLYEHGLYEKNTPLDDFDYELARRADERDDKEFISFEESLKECGLTYADLQD